MTTRRTSRNQRGFSFIEILVVMSIIVVLASAVAVVIPLVLKNQKKTECVNHVRNMMDMMFSEFAVGHKGWPKYNGKNFVLALIAANAIDPENKRGLETFFCPGDSKFNLQSADVARYLEIKKNKTSLKGQDYHELTSYAGRRNADDRYAIDQRVIDKGKPIICDDDDGKPHHPDGIVIGNADRSIRLEEWDDLGLAEPDEDEPEPFLGDVSPNKDLEAMSSNN
jgi:prepilin-type N-terminal cleavage/methylation domain-containing protein